MSLDCKRISNAMNVAVKKCCDSLGFSRALCKFVFTEDEDIDVGEYLDYAAKLQQIGVTLDIQKLKALTKLEFIKDETQDVWRPAARERQ